MGKAIQKWGVELQMDLAQEECAELIVAISHWRRNRINCTKDVIEEIADVKIMIRQLELMFGIEDVESVVKFKMERLAKILEE